MSMNEDNKLVAELARVLSNSRIALSGEINDSMISGIDLDVIASKIVEGNRESTGFRIISTDELKKMLEEIKTEKIPVPIEVIRSSDFKPDAADIEARFEINNRPIETIEGGVPDFVSYFKDRLYKMRHIIEVQGRRAIVNEMFDFAHDIEALKKSPEGAEKSVIGIVTNKIITKNGNLMLIIEDDTGELRIMFLKGTSQQAQSLFESGSAIVNDEVLAIKVRVGRGGLYIAKEVIFPDVPIKEKKSVETDVAVAFLSDIHVGSKKFMKANFLHMISWLNGETNPNQKELAGKIKYLVIGGDVVEGIGVYPGQEKDLASSDIYAQYRELFSYLDAIPEYIEVFVMPGNHDAVGRAEPQPAIGPELIKDFNKSNVHMLTNPSVMKLEGLEVLTYHGTSLDSMISAIPGLSYATPEKAMIEVLKRRHLSPIYGGNVIVPSKEDNLVIGSVPDIMHMGHIHKNGLANYHGVEIVNSGTWQSRTDLQVRTGMVPTPCVVPVYEMKKGTFSSINFSGEKTLGD